MLNPEFQIHFTRRSATNVSEMRNYSDSRYILYLEFKIKVISDTTSNFETVVITVFSKERSPFRP